MMPQEIYCTALTVITHFFQRWISNSEEKWRYGFWHLLFQNFAYLQPLFHPSVEFYLNYKNLTFDLVTTQEGFSHSHLTTRQDSTDTSEERWSYSPLLDLFLLPGHQTYLCHHLFFLLDSNLLDCLSDNHQSNWQVNQPRKCKLLPPWKQECFGWTR